MIVIAVSILPDFENHATQPPATPPNCTKLFRVVTLSVYQVSLIKYLPRFFETYAVFPPDIRVLLLFEVEARI
jgi:hypothetical protein